MSFASFHSLLACATCVADRNGITQQATNSGIFVMLGVMAVVFGCMAATAVSFARRSSRITRLDS
jgi:hypothetical protein